MCRSMDGDFLNAGQFARFLAEEDRADEGLPPGRNWYCVRCGALRFPVPGEGDRDCWRCGEGLEQGGARGLSPRPPRNRRPGTGLRLDSGWAGS